MELTLERRWKKEKYTIGTMLVNGVYFSETCEDKDRGLRQDMPLNEIRRKKVYGKTAIPTGTYVIDMDTVSPKFCNRAWAKPYNGKVPRLVNVPGYSGVLIHPFNTAEDSYGCIAVGENKEKGKVLNSTAYFRKLMDEHLIPAHKRGEKITLKIY